MKATFKVTFLLQKGKLKASGKAPIVTRIIVNGEMAAGTIAAADRGRQGECYILGHENQ